MLNRYAAAGCTLLVLVAFVGCATTEDAAEAPPTRAYRIQVETTDDRAAANATVRRLTDWWAALPPAEQPAGLAEPEFAPEIVWQPPYYRVRVGVFATRAAAEDALAALRQKFPDAFVARAAAPARK